MLLYLSGRKRGRSEDRVDGRSYSSIMRNGALWECPLQRRWVEPDVLETWESKFGCVVCFLRVCYFRRVVSFAYSLSVLGDLPMNLVSCIAAVVYTLLYLVISLTHQTRHSHAC